MRRTVERQVMRRAGLVVSNRIAAAASRALSPGIAALVVRRELEPAFWICRIGSIQDRVRVVLPRKSLAIPRHDVMRRYDAKPRRRYRRFCEAGIVRGTIAGTDRGAR